ncbi:transposon TX1 [Tanacetum coccineum]
MFFDKETLYESLNNIFIGTSQIRVFNAYDRKEKEVKGGENVVGKDSSRKWEQTKSVERDGRRYSDVLKNQKVEENKKKGENVEHNDGKVSNFGEYELGKRTIEVEIKDLESEILKRGIFGEVRDLDYLERLHNLCSTIGIQGTQIKYIGGLEVMIVFKSEETARNIMEDVHHGLRRWVGKLRWWVPEFRPFGRLTWISIIGVPIGCWNENIFRRIAAVWGMILDTTNCSLIDSGKGTQSLTMARMLIHTIESKLINEEVHIKIGKRSYKVVVIDEVRDIVKIDVDESDDESEQDDDEDVVVREDQGAREGGGKNFDGDEAEEDDRSNGGIEKACRSSSGSEVKLKSGNFETASENTELEVTNEAQQSKRLVTDSMVEVLSKKSTGPLEDGEIREQELEQAGFNLKNNIFGPSENIGPDENIHQPNNIFTRKGKEPNVDENILDLGETTHGMNNMKYVKTVVGRSTSGNDEKVYIAGKCEGSIGMRLNTHTLFH